MNPIDIRINQGLVKYYIRENGYTVYEPRYNFKLNVDIKVEHYLTII